MNIHIFQVPYDSGRRDERMGAGPGHLLDRGLANYLRAHGHMVWISEIESSDPFPSEIKTSFELYRQLGAQVREGLDQGRLPLVLSGNCSAALGGIAGWEGATGCDLGILWLDAHGDFNTPDISPSGFLDGMGLATAAGLGWKSLALSIPGFRPVLPERIVHLGGRDFDRDEEALLRQQGVALVTAPQVRENGLAESLEPALDRLRRSVRDVYLHLDLDGLDPLETPANLFPPQMAWMWTTWSQPSASSASASPSPAWASPPTTRATTRKKRPSRRLFDWSKRQSETG
ncbi:MAG TPA: arginase family protein [Anaerolineaceae bacterium]|nr:arginase family protein [Anaerolineaceae bacterium]